MARGLCPETSEPRTPFENRTGHDPMDVSLSGLLIRRKGEEDDGAPVMKASDLLDSR